jgi:predicted O-linked N-acetylglucosamine transferase (SPINDLY family)
LLTCTGNTFAGRVASSLLSAAGLPELITQSLDEYEALGMELATTPAMLVAARARLILHRHDHPLFDTGRFRRHLESAYMQMWDRHQRGDPPESFEVRPVT